MLAKYFFKKIFTEHYSTVNKEKCINYRSQKSPCSHCADHCPLGAITISEKRILIDESACRGCGICKVQCPTDAIDTTEFSEEKNLKNIHKKSRVLIGCEEEQSEGNIRYPCLHGLSPEYLALTMLVAPDKVLEFNQVPCKDCKISQEYQCLETSLTEAEALLHSLGMEPEFRIIRKKENLPKELEERLSRRALFEEMKNGSVSLGMDMARETLSDGQEIFPVRELLIEKLRLVSDKDRDLMDVELITPLFTTWEVAESCDGCGICASVCPSQALEIKREKRKVSLIHRGNVCTNCMLCSDVCPKSAMKECSVKLNQLMKNIVLKEMNMVPCPGCRQSSVVQESTMKKPPLCKSCEKREKIRKSLKRT